MAGHGEKFQGEKTDYIYESNILFSIKMENKIFNSLFTEIFVSKMFSKVSNKNFFEKTIKYIIFYQDGKSYIQQPLYQNFCFSLSL